MMLRPGPSEPAVPAWHPERLDQLAAELVRADGSSRVVIGVDGRSGSGKTTLARRLRDELDGAALVSTDDLAWHAPLFGWAPLAASGVLGPFRRGEAVSYRPPAWEQRDRAGRIEVPATASALILEGVGATQRALTGLVDVAIWVQSDLAIAERLGIARDQASGVNGDPAQSVAFWHEWMAAELPFVADDLPWERADLILAGVGAEPVEDGWVLAAAR